MSFDLTTLPDRLIGREMGRLPDKRQHLVVSGQLRHNLPTGEYTSLLKEAFNPAGEKPTEVHKRSPLQHE